MRWAVVTMLAWVFLIAACGSGGDSESAGSGLAVVEIRDMRLVFDGESCVYEGGEVLSPGPATLEFVNRSDGHAAMNLVWQSGEETVDDMLEYMGDEPSDKHAPGWSRDVRDVWRPTPPGGSYLWEGELEPAVHTMVCARLDPFGV